MIKVLILLTFKEGHKQDRLENIESILEFLNKNCQQVKYLAGVGSQEKIAFDLEFEQEQDWDQLQPELEIYDDFVEIVSDLQKPPKIYAFSVVE